MVLEPLAGATNSARQRARDESAAPAATGVCHNKTGRATMASMPLSPNNTRNNQQPLLESIVDPLCMPSVTPTPSRTTSIIDDRVALVVLLGIQRIWNSSGCIQL
jgi:hypothetical protein